MGLHHILNQKSKTVVHQRLSLFVVQLSSQHYSSFGVEGLLQSVQKALVSKLIKIKVN